MNVSVVGAGTMGNGIAQVFAQHGHAVALRDLSEDILSRARATIEKSLGKLVEKGKLSLDAPASSVVPELAQAKVLDGWDGAKPRLRAPKRPITLKQLLTHTAGYSYEIWRPEIARRSHHSSRRR